MATIDGLNRRMMDARGPASGSSSAPWIRRMATLAPCRTATAQTRDFQRRSNSNNSSSNYNNSSASRNHSTCRNHFALSVSHTASPSDLTPERLPVSPRTTNPSLIASLVLLALL